VSWVPLGQPQTPCSILPPVQVMLALRLTQLPLASLVWPIWQIVVVPAPVGLGGSIMPGIVVTFGVVVGATTGVAVGVGVGSTPVVVTGSGRGIWRMQFGGLPTSGGGQVCAETQFGGVPV
jgi:hypothetical protein